MQMMSHFAGAMIFAQDSETAVLIHVKTVAMIVEENLQLVKMIYILEPTILMEIELLIIQEIVAQMYAYLLMVVV
jgi:hypothetical protein